MEEDDDSGDGGEEDNEGSGGAPGALPARRRFFKAVRELDPSARRKRKAKFSRALLALMDTYG